MKDELSASSGDSAATTTDGAQFDEASQRAQVGAAHILSRSSCCWTMLIAQFTLIGQHPRKLYERVQKEDHISASSRIEALSTLDTRNKASP
jgi:hypothetical protein